MTDLRPEYLEARKQRARQIAKEISAALAAHERWMGSGLRKLCVVIKWLLIIAVAAVAFVTLIGAGIAGAVTVLIAAVILDDYKPKKSENKTCTRNGRV